MESNGLTIEWKPSGRHGMVTLTAKLAGEVIEAERLDVTKPKDRADFARRLTTKAPAIDAADIERQLLAIAGEVTSATDRKETDGDPLAELDASQIVRPERFITPDVSGLAIPSMTLAGDKPMGRWLLYLRWQDGRREKRQLPSMIALPDGRQLLVHPMPSEPTANTSAGWSKDARRKWLEGEPTPDPVEVFRAICERLAHYLDLPSDHAPGITATLALWVVLTYSFHAWPAVPYLFVGGPLGSGKSRVFDLLGQLAFRALPSANMSAAALFRTLHAQGGTLLLDEAERLRQSGAPDVQELLAMLLAGYKRGGMATRLEPLGDSFRTINFDVYGPKALACIAGLPPALASRTISLSMFRAPPGSEKPRRRIGAEPGKWGAIRDKLHALALEHGADWLALAERTDVCPAMSGRDFELWQPLLALAAWLDERGACGLFGTMRSHAANMIDAGKDDATPEADETLLRLLADAFRGGERVTSEELLERAQRSDAVTFRPWSPAGVSRRLRAYGIPNTRKSGSRREWRDLSAELFRRIQASYSIDLDFPPEAPA